MRTSLPCSETLGYHMKMLPLSVRRQHFLNYICRMEIIFGTQNKGKLAEARAICRKLGKIYGIELEAVPMPEKADIPEDGDSYRANSLQKAEWIWNRYHKSCFADDSGLEVAALGGAPGIHTARYCDRNFSSGMDKLLFELEQKGAMEATERKASFECCITLILAPEDCPAGMEAGKAYYFNGHCPGTISKEKCGCGGFGFDPVFMAEATPGLCMAEIDEDLKNSISHRALALEAMFKHLAMVKQ